MTISFHGAARTVTGSKHIITLFNGRKILLDCGMFQGLGKDTGPLNENFGFDPAELDMVILSHAHIDHSGLLPRLVKLGYNGQIICTPATKDLTEILLTDSAEIQAYEANYINKRRELKNLPPYEPLYTIEDVSHTVEQFKTFEYDEWFKVIDGVEALFTNAGHLVGSAAITLKIIEDEQQTTILYSADIGRYQSVLLQQPADAPQADYIILESTYGDKHHDITVDIIRELYNWIDDICIKKGGQLIIPAFSVGRTQEVLYALNQLSLEKRLPDVIYFVDSPLSMKATATIKQYTNHFNERLQKVLTIDEDPFDFPGLKYIESVEDSQRLVDHKKPCVILSASGTADAGRVKHHIKECVDNPNNGILFVGYCGLQTLGGQLLNGDKMIEVFGEPCEVKAKIGHMPGLSAHGDADDLVRFVSNQDPKKVRSVYLVHGEYAVQKNFCDRLKLKGFEQVEIPALHQVYETEAVHENI